MSRLSFSQRIALFASAIAPTARVRSAVLACVAPRARSFDGRYDARAAVIRTLVLEQRVEIRALERVDERDDLVGLEVVVMVERRGAVGTLGGLALGGRLRTARARLDDRLGHLRGGHRPARRAHHRGGLVAAR